MVNPDSAQLAFSQESLFTFNLCMALVIYGVSLDLTWEKVIWVFQRPKLLLVGLLSQFIILPVSLFGLIYFFNPHPSLALGILLVAACPGGSVSNFYSQLGGGNIALSLSLTAIATLLAPLFTPINFAFWQDIFARTSETTPRLYLDFWDVVSTVAMITILPVTLGMLTNRYFPKFTVKARHWMTGFSLIFFVIVILISFWENFEMFLTYIHTVFLLVLASNALAYLVGYGTARSFGLSKENVKTITIETGIQNSGLGLILIFNFFGGLGGMALVAAWWSVWDMFSGLLLASYWAWRSKKKNA